MENNLIRRTWTDEETRALLFCINHRKNEFESIRKKIFGYQHVLEDLLSMKVMKSPVTTTHLENKMKVLLLAYKNAKDNEGRTGESPCIIPYEKEMDEIYGDKPLISCSHVTTTLRRHSTAFHTKIAKTPTNSTLSTSSVKTVPITNNQKYLLCTSLPASVSIKSIPLKHQLTTVPPPIKHTAKKYPFPPASSASISPTTFTNCPKSSVSITRSPSATTTSSVSITQSPSVTPNISPTTTSNAHGPQRKRKLSLFEEKKKLLLFLNEEKNKRNQALIEAITKKN